MGTPAEATVAMNIGKSAWYTYKAWRLATIGDRKLHRLEQRLFDIIDSAASLQIDVAAHEVGDWKKNTDLLESVTRNLEDLDSKLEGKVKDYDDKRDKVRQYMSRLEALNFAEEYMGILANSMSRLRSNTINLNSIDIASVSDFSHLLYTLTSNIRAGDEIELDDALRSFEGNHKETPVYRSLRASRLNAYENLPLLKKTSANNKVFRLYQSFESGVSTKLVNALPEYNPVGSFNKRIIERMPERKKRSLELFLHDFNAPIEIKCSYKGLTLDKFNPQKRRKKAEKRNTYFLAECVVAGIISENLKEEVRTLDSRNYALFLKEIDSSDLIYNENSRSSNFFIDYFSSEIMQARVMTDFLKEAKSQYNISEEEIRGTLMLNDRSIQSLQRYGLIKPARRRSEHYTLVNIKGGGI